MDDVRLPLLISFVKCGVTLLNILSDEKTFCMLSMLSSPGNRAVYMTASDILTLRSRGKQAEYKFF